MRSEKVATRATTFPFRASMTCSERWKREPIWPTWVAITYSAPSAPPISARHDESSPQPSIFFCFSKRMSAPMAAWLRTS